MTVILNKQKTVAVDMTSARSFVRRLKTALKLGRREFNVCFVDDCAIGRLNYAHRGKARPTDVLSFPWHGEAELAAGTKRRDNARKQNGKREFEHFLGDIVISAETARHNARREGHSVANEIRWLILHGALHLLGYDHEADRGEMTALELVLRDRLGITTGWRQHALGARRR